ncbi:unnamed protein product, partial [Iphiclides podalirius]
MGQRTFLSGGVPAARRAGKTAMAARDAALRSSSSARNAAADARARGAMNRLLLPVLALAALAPLAAADGDRPRILDFDPWSWLPSNGNRSPSVMDFFFPPSRTPKNSNLDPPADRSPPKTTLTTASETLTTPYRERPTTVARKSGAKSKSTAPPPPHTTAYSKTKKGTHKTYDTDTNAEPKTTQPVKNVESAAQATTKAAATTSTSRPTKHYTIRPLIRTTATSTVVETESTLDTNSDGTETAVAIETAATTAQDHKGTGPTFSTTDSRPTDQESASTSTESTTLIDSTIAEEPDSREGYLPLRDKPQQTHVKINEQTKKEVSAFK